MYYGIADTTTVEASSVKECKTKLSLAVSTQPRHWLLEKYILDKNNNPLAKATAHGGKWKWTPSLSPSYIKLLKAEDTKYEKANSLAKDCETVKKIFTKHGKQTVLDIIQ